MKCFLALLIMISCLGAQGIPQEHDTYVSVFDKHVTFTYGNGKFTTVDGLPDIALGDRIRITPVAMPTSSTKLRKVLYKWSYVTERRKKRLFRKTKVTRTTHYCPDLNNQVIGKLGKEYKFKFSLNNSALYEPSDASGFEEYTSNFGRMSAHGVYLEAPPKSSLPSALRRAKNPRCLNSNSPVLLDAGAGGSETWQGQTWHAPPKILIKFHVEVSRPQP